jgi:hypothetical protein
MKRYRIKVEAGFRVAFQGDGTPRTDVFAVTVTNLSDAKVRVTHWATFEARVFWPRWIDRPIRKFVTRSTQPTCSLSNRFMVPCSRSLSRRETMPSSPSPSTPFPRFRRLPSPQPTSRMVRIPERIRKIHETRSTNPRSRGAPEACAATSIFELRRSSCDSTDGGLSHETGTHDHRRGYCNV